jgi:hypothetical protein
VEKFNFNHSNVTGESTLRLRYQERGRTINKKAGIFTRLLLGYFFFTVFFLVAFFVPHFDPALWLFPQDMSSPPF